MVHFSMEGVILDYAVSRQSASLSPFLFLVLFPSRERENLMGAPWGGTLAGTAPRNPDICGDDVSSLGYPTTYVCLK